MKTVTAIYTGQALVSPISEYFRSIYPDHQLINVLDDGLIKAVIKAGTMSTSVLRRLYSLCREAQEAGSDLIFQTCSSVGGSADLIQPFLDIPIVRIDRPMAEQAVRDYTRIAVLATLPTTLEPTMDLIAAVAAENGRTIDIVNGLAAGAFQALSAGDPETHDRTILQTAGKLVDSCDVFVLAQGSMARMKDGLTALGRPVLTSPESGTEALRPYLEGRV